MIRGLVSRKLLRGRQETEDEIDWRICGNPRRACTARLQEILTNSTFPLSVPADATRLRHSRHLDARSQLSTDEELTVSASRFPLDSISRLSNGPIPSRRFPILPPSVSPSPIRLGLPFLPSPLSASRDCIRGVDNRFAPPNPSNGVKYLRDPAATPRLSCSRFSYIEA